MFCNSIFGNFFLQILHKRRFPVNLIIGHTCRDSTYLRSTVRVVPCIKLHLASDSTVGEVKCMVLDKVLLPSLPQIVEHIAAK